MPPCIFEKRKVQGLLQRRRALRFCADFGAPQWPGNPKRQQSAQRQHERRSNMSTAATSAQQQHQHSAQS